MSHMSNKRYKMPCLAVSNMYCQMNLSHLLLSSLKNKDLFLNSQNACSSSVNKTPRKTKGIIEFGSYSVKINVISEYNVKQDAFPLTDCVGVTSDEACFALIHMKRPLKKSKNNSVRVQPEIQEEPHVWIQNVQPYRKHTFNPMVLNKMLKCLPRSF